MLRPFPTLPPETLLSGVTTIRDVGSSDFIDVALCDAIAAGDVIEFVMKEGVVCRQ